MPPPRRAVAAAARPAPVHGRCSAAPVVAAVRWAQRSAAVKLALVAWLSPAVTLAPAAWPRRAAARPPTASRLELAQALVSPAVLSAAAPDAGRDVLHADPDDGPRGALDAWARRPPAAAALACARVAVPLEEAVVEGPACAVAAALAPAVAQVVSVRRPVVVLVASVRRPAAAGVAPDAAPVAAAPEVWAVAVRPSAAPVLLARPLAFLLASSLGCRRAAGPRSVPSGSARPSRLQRKLAGTRRPAPAARC